VHTQHADKVAGYDIAGDVQQPPGLRTQPCRSEADEIGNVAAGALDSGKAFGAGARGRSVTDREKRQPALTASVCQRPDAIGAGAQDACTPSRSSLTGAR